MMVFNSWPFLLFFLIFLVLYQVTARRLVLQNALILAASYIFYGFWDVRFPLLLLGCTVTQCIAGWGIVGESLATQHVINLAAFTSCIIAGIMIASHGEAWPYCLAVLPYMSVVTLFIWWAASQPETHRKQIYLIGSIVYNLSVLCFFKYANFFVANMAQTLSQFGIQVDITTLSILLPVGLSFFTFQSMSYSIDVYRGQLRATDDVVKFAAYTSFFLQLIAGPIEHASHLLPQFDHPRRLQWDNIREGVILFLWGLYKKVVVADNIAPIVDRIFGDTNHATGSQALLGALAFMFQIYTDFSGYSDMARGLARMLGFDLIINFNLPYFSRTPSEFWHRWHIGLSTWLRDYLYIPLGGNRDSNWLTSRNLLITMLLGGLWHGASWTFLLWGFYHGCLLVLYRAANIDRKLLKASWIMHIAAWAIMGTLTLYGWIIFRAQNIETLSSMTRALLHGSSTFDAEVWAQFGHYVLPLVIIEIIMRFSETVSMPARLLTLLRFHTRAFVILSLIFVSAHSGEPFIYFNF